MFTGTLERAILETLAYSDIFDYPLQLKQLHRYLPMRAELDELPAALKSLQDEVGMNNGYYFLSGRDEIVSIRKQREARSQKMLPYALRYGRILGSLPFIRMVALTGSLAVLNITQDADFDYMLVAAPGRVWTARAFALLLNRITNLFGHTLCPNLIISENKLEWSAHDLYSARELCQMIPITGLDVCQRLMKVNEWVREFLPNVFLSLRGATSGSDEAISNIMTGIAHLHLAQVQVSSGFGLLAMTEGLLRGKLGDIFECWEMNRKIARFSKQDGFGEETVFTAEICQGNFGHHRKSTQDMFENKLMSVNSPLPLGEGLGCRTEPAEVARVK